MQGPPPVPTGQELVGLPQAMAVGLTQVLAAPEMGPLPGHACLAEGSMGEGPAQIGRAEAVDHGVAPLAPPEPQEARGCRVVENPPTLDRQRPRNSPPRAHPQPIAPTAGRPQQAVLGAPNGRKT